MSEPARAFQIVLRAGRARPWGVKQGARLRFCADLTVQVPMTSSFTKDGTPCLVGAGVVRTLKRGAIVVTA